MVEQIAKRYIGALKQDADVKSLQIISDIFSELALSFDDENFKNIINNPSVKVEDKTNILLDSVKSAKSDVLNNLIKILSEHKRLNIIPAIAIEMKKDLARTNKNFSGVVYSDEKITAKVIKDLSTGLGAKYGSKITLEFVQNDFNGIKVDVEDLGIEINFSKTRINNQIIEHIVKAI